MGAPISRLPSGAGFLHGTQCFTNTHNRAWANTHAGNTHQQTQSATPIVNVPQHTRTCPRERLTQTHDTGKHIQSLAPRHTRLAHTQVHMQTQIPHNHPWSGSEAWSLGRTCPPHANTHTTHTHTGMQTWSYTPRYTQPAHTATVPTPHTCFPSHILEAVPVGGWVVQRDRTWVWRDRAGH